jgi:hypothetical protein
VVSVLGRVGVMSEFRTESGLVSWPSGAENKQQGNAEHIFAFIPALKYYC